jgi:hypothetical protein
MNKFKSSFRFYEKAAPFPGQCVFSGETNNLWEVGSMVIQGQGVPVLLSDRVLIELATSAGFVTKKEHETAVAEQAEIIAKQAAQLEEAPKLLKELSENVNNVLSDFVTTLAGVASNNVPNGDKGSKASTGGSKAKSGASDKAGQGEKQGAEPSSESSSE